VLVFLAVGLAALAAGYFVAVDSQPEQPTPDPGAVLLGVTLPDLSGHPQSLAQWRGKVLVVNFWATWCPPCLKEIPEFIRMQAHYGPKGVQFVGIAIDDKTRVLGYIQQTGLNYPVLMAETAGIDLSRSAGNRLGGLPFTVLIDREGRAARMELGVLDEHKLAPLIERLL
jgi:thiol-disulfide isomerase/thioredoxin